MVSTNGISWRLRRVAVGLRQADVASRAGMSTTRLSAIERGEAVPSQTDIEHLDKILPPISQSLTEPVEASA